MLRNSTSMYNRTYRHTFILRLVYWLTFIHRGYVVWSDVFVADIIDFVVGVLLFVLFFFCCVIEVVFVGCLCGCRSCFTTFHWGLKSIHSQFYSSNKVLWPLPNNYRLKKWAHKIRWENHSLPITCSLHCLYVCSTHTHLNNLPKCLSESM